MESEQPQFYASLISHLSAEEQGTLQSVMSRAAEIRQAQLLAQQQVAATAAANGGAA